MCRLPKGQTTGPTCRNESPLLVVAEHETQIAAGLSDDGPVVENLRGSEDIHHTIVVLDWRR